MEWKENEDDLPAGRGPTMSSVWTENIDDTAGAVRAALEASPRRASEALRIAFTFAERLDRATPSDRVEMVRLRPRSTTDPGYDALLGALVEHLCARWGITTPKWVDDPDRFVEPWWFVSGLRSLHASALVQSPISFARHGVFICDDALSYA